MTSFVGRCSRGIEKRFGMEGFFAADFFAADFFEGFFGPGVLTAAGLFGLFAGVFAEGFAGFFAGVFALREVGVARFFADFGVATGREFSQTRRFGATLR